MWQVVLRPRRASLRLGLETDGEGFGPGIDSWSRLREASLGRLFVILLFHLYSSQTLIVTRKKVAGIDVPPFPLLFCAFARSTSRL